MTWTDLDNPVPRETPHRYEPYLWPSAKIDYLEAPENISLPAIEQVIANRRTRRTFGSINKQKLSTWLWLSNRVIATGHDQYGFPLTQRPAPSAGAIHPIHLVFAQQGNVWQWYDPVHHGLARFEVASDVMDGLLLDVSTVLDPGEGQVVLYVAEPGMTAAKYQNADSLVWRDTGVLLGHMALVAEALQLNFCPLGITGDPWVSKLDQEGKLVGVGVALLGSRSSS